MTKKDRISRCREIIDTNDYHIDFSPSHLAEFTALTGLEGVMAIQRRPNPKYPSDTRHLYGCRNGLWESVSWLKAITPRKPLQLEKEVMRSVIAPDIMEYRDSCGVEACEHCGSKDYLQVDHSAPAFDDIALAFIDQFGAPQTEPCSNGVGYRFVGIDLEAEWITFHTANANYQILCRSCNASKGKTKSVRRNLSTYPN